MKHYRGRLDFSIEVYTSAPNYQEAQQNLIDKHGMRRLETNHRNEVIVEEVEAIPELTQLDPWDKAMLWVSDLIDSRAERPGHWPGTVEALRELQAHIKKYGPERKKTFLR